MNWQHWLLIIAIAGVFVGGIFLGKGCNKPETVVIEAGNTPLQDSLSKYGDLLREISIKLDTTRKTEINKIQNEINHYSNLPDSVLPNINDALADSIRARHIK